MYVPVLPLKMQDVFFNQLYLEMYDRGNRKPINRIWFVLRYVFFSETTQNHEG